MSKWRCYSHHFACGFMCLCFAGLGILDAKVIAVSANNLPRLVFTVLFGVLAVAGIWFQIRYLRCIICEFSFDGQDLRFRTLGKSEAETRSLSQLSKIKKWSGRGGGTGLRLFFRDRKQAFLEFSMSNAQELADHLRHALP